MKNAAARCSLKGWSVQALTVGAAEAARGQQSPALLPALSILSGNSTLPKVGWRLPDCWLGLELRGWIGQEKLMRERAIASEDPRRFRQLLRQLSAGKRGQVGVR